MNFLIATFAGGFLAAACGGAEPAGASGSSSSSTSAAGAGGQPTGAGGSDTTGGAAGSTATGGTATGGTATGGTATGGTATGGTATGGTAGSAGVGGAGAMGGTGGAPSTTGTGGQTSSGTGMVCVPGSMEPCYDGPDGTQDVGACKGGSRTCLADGSALGPCEGQVLPSQEVCFNGVDEDCDGDVMDPDGGCACMPGSMESCYSGPPGSMGVGACQAGTHTCSADGSGYGPCSGEVLPSVEICSTPLDESCDGAPSCAGAFRWARSFDDGWSGDGIAADKAGNSFVALSPHQSVDYGNGLIQVSSPNDVGIAKLDPLGNTVWSKVFAAPMSQAADALTLGPSGDIFMAGFSNGGTIDFGNGVVSGADQPLFLVKLSAAGQALWSKSFGAPGTTPSIRSVTTDPSENVIITGYTSGSIDFGSGPLMDAGSSDVFVAKFAPDGSPLWSKRFGDGNTQLGLGVAADSAGNLYVTGKMGGSVDFGNGPLTNSGGLDAFVVKLDPQGTALWSKRFGNSGNTDQGGYAVAVDSSDDAIVTGAIDGSINFGNGTLTSAGYDVFVVKLNPQGTALWSKIYGGAGIQSGGTVKVDDAGNILVGGSFSGTLDFGNGPLPGPGQGNGFLAKLDSSGATLWSRGVGGTAFTKVHKITCDPAGNVLITGESGDMVDFGGGPVSNPVGLNSFVARYGP